MENQKTNAKAQLDEIQKELSKCNEGIENRQKELIQLLQDKAATQGKLQKFDTMLEQINIRKAELNKRLLDRKTHEAGLSQELGEYEKNLAQVNEAIKVVKGKEKEKRLCQ